MALDKSKVDDLLVDFVVRNQDDLTLNQKENPALYDSVISALSVLARKFGSGQKPIVAPAPAPIIEPPIITPEPTAPNALDFEVGDVFERKGANGIKFFIKQINIESDEVLIAKLENINDILDYTIGEVENKFNKKIWVKTGKKVGQKTASKLPFKDGDISEVISTNKKYVIMSTTPTKNKVTGADEIDIALFEEPTKKYLALDIQAIIRWVDNGEWKIVGNINDNKPTMLPIKLGDVIADFKLKQDFLVRYIDPYTDAVHLAEFGEPNLTAHKYSFSDAMAYLNNGRFVIKPKTYSKSAPPPAAPVSVTTAIKKTAAKTKKAVSPEEKELLDAIKTLKPLASLDPDIQKEIDELNVKLTELRNKKD